MEKKHTVKSYDAEFGVLNDTLAEMFKKTGDQLKLTVQAVQGFSTDLAQTVINGDDVVNELYARVDRTTIKMLATRQPVAIDLRKILASLKIASDLERIADYCVNIGRQVMDIKSGITLDSASRINEMAQATERMLAQAAESYTASNARKASELESLDDQIDNLYVDVLNILQEEMAGDPAKVPTGSKLLYIARYLERLADHAVNIGYHVKYMVTGERDKVQDH